MLAVSKKDGRNKRDRMRDICLLLRAMDGQPMKAHQISEKLGCTREQVVSAVEDMWDLCEVDIAKYWMFCPVGSIKGYSISCDKRIQSENIATHYFQRKKCHNAESRRLETMRKAFEDLDLSNEYIANKIEELSLENESAISAIRRDELVYWGDIDVDEELN